MGTAEALFRGGSRGSQIAALIKTKRRRPRRARRLPITELDTNREKLNQLNSDRGHKQNNKCNNMKNHFVAIIAAAALTVSAVVIRQKAQAQNASLPTIEKPSAMMAGDAGLKTNNQEMHSIFVTNISRRRS